VIEALQSDLKRELSNSRHRLAELMATYRTLVDARPT
jgi:hypothetical protein